MASLEATVDQVVGDCNRECLEYPHNIVTVWQHNYDFTTKYAYMIPVCYGA